MPVKKYDAVATRYSPPLAARICDELVTGRSLLSICADEGMPSKATVFRWLAGSAEFRRLYALAREMQADTLQEEMIAIADDASDDWVEIDAGRIANPQSIPRAKLRIDSRRRLLGVFNQKRSGIEPAESEVQVFRVVREIVTPPPRPAESQPPSAPALPVSPWHDR
jgi:hypothetical protein